MLQANIQFAFSTPPITVIPKSSTSLPRPCVMSIWFYCTLL